MRWRTACVHCGEQRQPAFAPSEPRSRQTARTCVRLRDIGRSVMTSRCTTLTCQSTPDSVLRPRKRAALETPSRSRWAFRTACQVRCSECRREQATGMPARSSSGACQHVSTVADACVLWYVVGVHQTCHGVCEVESCIALRCLRIPRIVVALVAYLLKSICSSPPHRYAATANHSLADDAYRALAVTCDETQQHSSTADG